MVIPSFGITAKDFFLINLSLYIHIAQIIQMNQITFLSDKPFPQIHVVEISVLFFQPITNGVATNNIVHANNNSGANKVIDVVDLDDDDDTPPAPAPLRQNQIIIPTGQVRIVPNTQTLTYAVVSNGATSTTMTSPAGMNRVVIARPQQAGQVLVTRNGVGPVVARAPQVIKFPLSNDSLSD